MKLKKYINTKNISKILTLAVLLSSIPIHSFASVLSEDGRYETFRGTSFAINDIIENDKVGVEIEGQTLVSPMKNASYSSDGKTQINKLENGKINKLSLNGKYIMMDSKINEKLKLKKNTEYTLIIQGHIFSSGGTEVIPFFENNASINEIDRLTVSKNGEYFSKKIYFSTNLEEITAFGFYTSNNENVSGIDVYYYIVEGISKNTSNEYFEGVKSIGENKNENSIEISSQTGNLIYGVEQYSNTKFYGLTLNTEDNDILCINGTTDSVKYDIPYTSLDRNKIKVQANVIYNVTTEVISGTYESEFELKTAYRVQDDVTGTVRWMTAPQFKCENPSTVSWVRLYTYPNNVTRIFNDYKIRISITEKESSENASIFNNDSIKISLQNPLRAISPDIKDTIIKINNKWYVKRVCKQITFDGTESNWYKGTHESAISGVAHIANVSDKINDGKKGHGNALISDKFLNEAKKGWTSLEEGYICTSSTLNHQIGFNVSEDTTVEQFKQWLNKNPVTVIYQLETPVYEPLNISSEIKLFKGVTHIKTNSIIPATISITVDRVANRAKEYSELAKENPTLYNISLARMWINLMRESILKDEFHDTIDTITEVSDMVLEKKTASANLDLYIKSQNLLSMSLNTNSISFEDFSGVEDMVKDSAVNISINSSLPYNLNAYLATDIQNSDKSNSMNLDILSIKENSELNYQKFSAINNKLILKSNCESGNSKQHNIDLKLNAGVAHEKDVYKTTIKFEAEQL